MRTKDGRPFWTVEAKRTFACMESHDWWQRHPGYLAEARRRAEELADVDGKSVYGQYALRALADVMENVNTEKWYRRQQKRAS
jgi:hypothetical protein